MAFKGAPGGHHEPYWDSIKRIIEESDVVLEILDSRLIELSRNEEVEALIQESGRPMIYVINKSDLVSKEKIALEIEDMRKNAEVVLVSAKNSRSIKLLLYEIKKVFKKYGKREKKIRGQYDPKPKYREAISDIVVSVLGYPNVGKSSIINALCHKKKMPVSKKAGTTHGVHWIRATDEIKLIDSPGVIPLKKDDEIRYGLIGARDSERLKNPELVADSVIKLFLRDNKKALEDFYNITLDESEEDYDSIIEKIGRARMFLIKGGNVDYHKTANLIVRNWQDGKLRL